MYSQKSLAGICRLICRIGTLLEDFADQQGSGKQYDGKYRYCRQALENQLMNISTTRGYEWVLLQLVYIALVFFQRIPKISVDLKSMLQVDCTQIEDRRTTRGASTCSDFVDFQAILISAHKQVDADTRDRERTVCEKVKEMLARHLFLCPHGVEVLDDEKHSIAITDIQGLLEVMHRFFDASMEDGGQLGNGEDARRTLHRESVEAYRTVASMLRDRKVGQ
eukprot:766732-Hanusia_phi.AAC.1